MVVGYSQVEMGLAREDEAQALATRSPISALPLSATAPRATRRAVGDGYSRAWVGLAREDAKEDEARARAA